MKRILVLASVALVGACQSPSPNTASVPASSMTTLSTAGFDPLPNDALKTLIVGKVLHLGKGNSVATYFADGKYDSVGTKDHWTGTYAFDGDKVCVHFMAGPTRKGSWCGQIAMIGTDYWLIATNGDRWKVKSITPVAEPAPKPS
ncbi:hypothetical protein [Mesorhizobium sp. Cs1321R2N1]|uniref:hypothetical protein n=1 Tax=Mesorhizobium sp. Cs1321R2N1 TaxID=3015174 RepID=UPI00301DC43A